MPVRVLLQVVALQVKRANPLSLKTQTNSIAALWKNCLQHRMKIEQVRTLWFLFNCCKRSLNPFRTHSHYMFLVIRIRSFSIFDSLVSPAWATFYSFSGHCLGSICVWVTVLVADALFLLICPSLQLQFPMISSLKVNHHASLLVSFSSNFCKHAVSRDRTLEA